MTDPTNKPDLLLELVHKMQRQACEYLQGNQGRKDFVSDIIGMLDGPEQRAAEAARPAPEAPAARAEARGFDMLGWEINRLRQLADGLGAYAGGMDLARITEIRELLATIEYPSTPQPVTVAQAAQVLLDEIARPATAEEKPDWRWLSRLDCPSLRALSEPSRDQELTSPYGDNNLPG